MPSEYLITCSTFFLEYHVFDSWKCFWITQVFNLLLLKQMTAIYYNIMMSFAVFEPIQNTITTKLSTLLQMSEQDLVQHKQPKMFNFSNCLVLLLLDTCVLVICYVYWWFQFCVSNQVFVRLQLIFKKFDMVETHRSPELMNISR